MIVFHVEDPRAIREVLGAIRSVFVDRDDAHRDVVPEDLGLSVPRAP